MTIIRKATMKMSCTRGENKLEKEEFFYFSTPQEADEWLEHYKAWDYKINEIITVTVQD